MLIFVMHEKFAQCNLVSETMPSSRQSVDKKSHAVETVKCAALSQNRLICPMLFFATALFSAEGLARERGGQESCGGVKKNVQHGIF